MLYGQSHEETDSLVSARLADFTALEEFLPDEFSLLLTFAFDELATYWAYVEDFVFYDTLGPIFRKWIQAVAKDEYHHYVNSMAVIKAVHHKRIGQIPHKLQRIIAWYLEQNPYHNHFLLDGKAIDASEKGLTLVSGNILRHFSL